MSLSSGDEVPARRIFHHQWKKTFATVSAKSGQTQCSKISTGLGSYVATCLAFGAARQAHCKHRALAWLARHGHVATHHARELAGDSKTKSGAAEALSSRGIGLGGFLEQLSLLLRRHADAGVGDGELGDFLLRVTAAMVLVICAGWNSVQRANIGSSVTGRRGCIRA